MFTYLKKFFLRKMAVRSGVRIASDVHIGPNTIVSASKELDIGENSYIGKNCSIQVNGSIGCGVLIANNVGVVGRLDHEYRVPGVLVRDGLWVGRDDKLASDPANSIIIQNDVWIGFGAIVLSGIKIGTGAIVSAGALVREDVPEFAIVGGVPSRIIGYRFDNDKEKSLHKEVIARRYG